MDDFDIVDLIFEKLAPADDEWERLGYDPVKPKADLVSCSLVCRSWCEGSRRHLFRSVLFSFTSEEEDVPRPPESLNLAQEGKWERFHNQQNVDNPSLMKPRKTLPMLIEFLRDRPKLASSIRQLSLRGFPHSWRCPDGPQTGWPAWFANRDHTKYVPPWLVIALLQILPDLQTLRLRDIFLCIDSNSDIAITSKPFDHSLVSLDQLSISYPLAKSSCKQGQRLLQLLNRCVSARTLQVSVPDGDRVIMTDGHLSQIDTLVLFEVPYETGLPRHLLGLNVRSLTLLSAKASDTPAYDRCFREVGRTLQELYIVEYNVCGRETFVFDISPCVNLERLHIEASLYLDSPSAADPVIASLMLLAPGLSKLRQLREFRIQLRVFSPREPFGDEGLAELAHAASAMNQRLIPCIRALGIAALLVAFETRPGTKEVVREQMRALFEGLEEEELVRYVDMHRGFWLINSAAHRHICRIL